MTRQDNVTVSVLSLIPGRRHHDRQLLCRAENPSLPMATMEDMITLNVACEYLRRLGFRRRFGVTGQASLSCYIFFFLPVYF